MNYVIQTTAAALTTDAWTSVSNDILLGVTALYFLEDFSYKSRCWTVKYASGSHTADALCSYLEAVFLDWGINQHTGFLPLYVVRDNGANVKISVNMMKTVKSVACFAHTLQLVINEVLSLEDMSEVRELLVLACEIVGHFKTSSLATKKLQQVKEQLGLSKHKLIQDCRTRWTCLPHRPLRRQRIRSNLTVTRKNAETWLKIAMGVQTQFLLFGMK